ncbi:MAG: hypothetical protein HY530_07070 [Chloroflexi bacterium]|nr:hypothetical protein [Chloroflexota bacterium]
MELNTTSQVVSFARDLEELGARFYESLTRRHSGDAEVWRHLASENRKNVTQVERAYYGVISDALEGCFSFAIDPDKYAIEAEPAGGASYHETVKRAVEMEEKIVRFYLEAAEQSKSLMADVPHAFTLVAKKRNSRIPKLMALLGKEG